MGLVYDKNEGQRAKEYLLNVNEEMQKIDELSDKKKDVIRFAIVGLGAIFIIVMVKILTKKRQ
jgi:hypothetical protein